MIRSLLCGLSLSLAAASAQGADPATQAINQLGLELFRSLAKDNPDGNVLISPYSIQSSLVLAYVGAAGETRREMGRVLHFPDDDAPLQVAFGNLRRSFAQAENRSKTDLDPSNFTLRSANRLYAQQDFPIRESYLAKLFAGYSSTAEGCDFKQQPDVSRLKINQWVEEQTQNKIHDLIPAGSIDEKTRLVLVNALYFKSAWLHSFDRAATKPLPFSLQTKATVEVPTMHAVSSRFGYVKFRNFVAVTLPYSEGCVQTVVLLPNKSVGLDTIANELTIATLLKLTPDGIRESTTGQSPEIDLFLPRIKIEGSTIALAKKLQALGLKTAFDLPRKSANFDGIYPIRPPDDYLALSEVFHQTFLSLDEDGTEAAAASASIVVLAPFGGPAVKPERIKVRVDRPFLFMIQHCETGACLFLGRATDPR